MSAVKSADLSGSMMAAKYGVYSAFWTGDDVESIARHALNAKDNPELGFPAVYAFCVVELRRRPESYFVLGSMKDLDHEAVEKLFKFAADCGVTVLAELSTRSFRFSSREIDREEYWRRICL